MTKTVTDIYSSYRIMPALQMHQLRVASVASVLIESLNRPVDRESILCACLFHDMGNIIKFDLPYFPQFVKPEGLIYWERVKAEFIAKYGTNEHEATLKIAEELHLSQEVKTLIGGLGFSNMEEIEQQTSPELKLCEYADMRVGPFGVISLDERVREGRERYSKKRSTILFNTDDFERLTTALGNIERDIFSDSSIRPKDITDDAISGTLDHLKVKEI